MNFGSPTIVFLIFLKDLLTGSTQFTPSPCTFEGDFSLMKCPLLIQENPNDSKNSQNVLTWFRQHETKGWTRVGPEINSRLLAIENRLEFWPVETSDSGKYCCVLG
ncbi:hypothetical protein NDU88_006509 [Pleurodeles waltl]|uniref:Ig-like domain-containing protein n=2 Tax=Pleurodeles waltl TaxID=8319 RepID=A0AAV7NTN6_PLEWA|nr:hypothetical protein NDU88_006509 [Pleurodeles waltl]